MNATLARLRQEKLRPLIPSIILRGNATNPGGTLSTGSFGGGVNGGPRYPYSRPWLVLGMPGTGKTTFARRLVDVLLRDGRAPRLLQKGHPLTRRHGL